MCGIVGIVPHPPGDAALLERDVRRMAAAIVHRGPDAEGLLRDARRRPRRAPTLEPRRRARASADDQRQQPQGDRPQRRDLQLLALRAELERAGAGCDTETSEE